MNLQLTQVLSDITGLTGLKIIRAIVAGERDPQHLAAFREGRYRASQEEIAKALTGTWKPEYVFIVMQHLEAYDFYAQQIAACDTEVERLYAAFKPRWEAPEMIPTLPPITRNSRCKNQSAGNVRQALFRGVGVDLTPVDGLNAASVQTILSEIGTDTPALALRASAVPGCPSGPRSNILPRGWVWPRINDISSGVLRSRTLKLNNRARQAFRQAAESVARSDNAFGAYYRRKRAQYGLQVAIVATAHQIVRVVYFMLKPHVPYDTDKAQDSEAKRREHELSRLKRQAAQLGTA